MANLVGRTFGIYEVKEELGRGGMGVVYRAYDTSVDRDVALKVLPVQLTLEPGFLERFQHEGRTIARLEHPHILPLYAVGEQDGLPFLAARYITGGTLGDRIDTGQISLVFLNKVIIQIADALAAAHQKGIIHRDVKPGNILLDEDDNAYLADFGIAKTLEGSVQHTVEGGLVGTPAYMAPEQWRGEQLDARTDVYALACLVFHALTGKLPYEATGPTAFMVKHINDPVPDIRALRPDLPDELDELLQAALAKSLDDRPPSAREFARVLTATIQELDDDLRTLPMLTEQHVGAIPPGKSRLIWIVGGVIALLALVTGGLALGGVFGGGVSSTATPDAVAVQVTSTPELIAITATPPETPTPTAEVSLAEVMSQQLRQSRIAFSSDLDTQAQAEIYTIDADGTDLARLTVNDGEDRYPAWSPDGSQIVFASDRDGDWEIYVMDANGLNPVRLTDSPGSDWDPDWSPDGRRIAFVSERDGNREIYIMNADGSEPVRVTDHSARDESPDWSPDGSRLAFSSSRSGSDDLFVIDADVSNLQRLTSAPNSDLAPIWSPDGTHIAFLANRASSSGGGPAGGAAFLQLWVHDLASNEDVPLYEHGGRDLANPVWSPGAEWVAFIEPHGPGSALGRITGLHLSSGETYEILGGSARHKDLDWYWGP